MEMNPVDELKRGYRTTFITGITIIASVFVYAAIVELIKIRFAPFEGFSPFPEIEILRYVFLGIAIVEFFLVRFLRNLTLSGKTPIQRTSQESPLSSFIQRLATTSIMIYAICESVAIYGLVLFLLAGSSLDFYAFMVLSLIYFAIYFPRYNQWEEWINFYSNIYRTRYAEFLKIDFPRVPFTRDYKLFKKMGDYGESLVNLHLLKPAPDSDRGSPELDTPIARFQGKGNNEVEKVRYEPVGAGHALPLLYINKEQYFEGISPELWEYRIGGYQVCDKWLKDRKGRTLSLDDIKHYCRIVTSLSKTIKIQKVIDYIYPAVEKETTGL
ncbi:MAG: type ISP restriction/modification enzyme [Nitrospirota bacterium]